MKSSRRSRRHQRERGAILIVALLLAAIIAISLGTYVNLSISSLRLANRTFYNNAAMNCAETGIEDALWALNQVVAGVNSDTAWDGWDRSDGVSAKRTFTDFTLGTNAVASVKVFVDQYNPTGVFQPTAVAQASITLPSGGPPLTKTLEVKLNRRSVFSMGMVAKSEIKFGGNASIDSYNSSLGPYNAPLPTGGNNRYDRGSAGSASVKKDSVVVGNADIWGYIAVGSSDIASAVDVGPNGTIADFTKPQGTVDTSRIATDFTANFAAVTAPNHLGFNLGDINASATVGVAGATQPTTYYINSMKLAGNNSFNIQGPVILVISGKVEIKGNAGFNVAPNTNTVIYGADEIKIGGNASYGGSGEDKLDGLGITNTNVNPLSLQIYGTSDKAKVQIKGNGSLTAVVYSPNAHVKLGGNGDIYGSFVGDSFHVKGNAAFHYDETLANFGSNNPWKATKWRELVSAADRAVYAAQLSF